MTLNCFWSLQDDKIHVLLIIQSAPELLESYGHHHKSTQGYGFFHTRASGLVPTSRQKEKKNQHRQTPTTGYKFFYCPASLLPALLTPAESSSLPRILLIKCSFLGRREFLILVLRFIKTAKTELLSLGIISLRNHGWVHELQCIEPNIICTNTVCVYVCISVFYSVR